MRIFYMKTSLYHSLRSKKLFIVIIHIITRMRAIITIKFSFIILIIVRLESGEFINFWNCWVIAENQLYSQDILCDAML